MFVHGRNSMPRWGEGGGETRGVAENRQRVSRDRALFPSRTQGTCIRLESPQSRGLVSMRRFFLGMELLVATYRTPAVVVQQRSTRGMLAPATEQVCRLAGTSRWYHALSPQF